MRNERKFVNAQEESLLPLYEKFKRKACFAVDHEDEVHAKQTLFLSGVQKGKILPEKQLEPEEVLKKKRHVFR